jgi:electron transfer flavoprotein beta subunit
MQLVVLLAGIVDPKWRLERLALRPDAGQADETGLPKRLSPFDEAALETALKLRDADPAVRCSVVVVGDAASDPLLRAVLAFRPHRALRFDTSGLALWDPFAAVRLLGAALDALGAPPDLVLMGREFGDADDGVLPALLAEARGFLFFGQAHAVMAGEGGLLAIRTRGPREEQQRLAPPALVSITNDRGNRLRHPLMKNVALAKRETLEILSPPPLDPARALEARSLSVVPPPGRGAGACRILGGPLDAQVTELADYLRGWRRGASP